MTRTVVPAPDLPRQATLPPCAARWPARSPGRGRHRRRGATGPVGTGEALERPRRRPRVMPGPSSCTSTHGAPRRRCGPAPPPACPAGVCTSALPTRLPTTWRSRSSSPSTVTPSATSAVTTRSGATARASAAASTASTPRSTGARVQRPSLVETGEQQQVVDQRRHPHRLLLGAAHRLVELGGVVETAVAVELGVAADRRDRRAQLVRRVGDEPAQARLRRRALGERVLDPGHHRVERVAELARLGARRAPRARAARGRRRRSRVAVAVMRLIGRTPRRSTQNATSAEDGDDRAVTDDPAPARAGSSSRRRRGATARPG